MNYAQRSDGHGWRAVAGPGDLLPGETYHTTAPVVVPPPPSPLEQIRAIEQTPLVSDAMQRGSRLVALSYAMDELIRVAALKGQTVTRQQAHDWSMVNDGNYKTLYDAEQVIKPLRTLV